MYTDEFLFELFKMQMGQSLKAFGQWKAILCLLLSCEEAVSIFILQSTRILLKLALMRSNPCNINNLPINFSFIFISLT